jgi:molybdate/tungstate transport system permease protein
MPTKAHAALALLVLHAVVFSGLCVFGVDKPTELLALLLLAANGVIAALVSVGRKDGLLGIGSMFLIAAHATVGHRLAPDSLTSGALLMVNLIVLYVGVQLNRYMPSRHWYTFVGGYFVLYVLFIVSAKNAEPLFLLFVLGMAACSRSMRLLAGFWCVALSFTVGQPYAWEFSFISVVVVMALFGAQGQLRSTTALVFLGVGLALVFLVLLPIIIVLLSEDVHNLLRILDDPRVRDAIRVTFLTATATTIILTLFCVPLAYGISRLRFPGRTLLLALIDVPIVVPQSVAGVALVAVLGRQQVLGEVVYNLSGLRFDGTVLGICAAQLFVAMPFLVRPSVAAFDAVPESLELAAQSLGAAPSSAFFRVALPLASRGILLGAVLAWARAAGEFGALLFIAPTPETIPVLAWNRFNSVGMVESAPLVAAMLAFSMLMFFLLQLLAKVLPSVSGLEDSTAPLFATGRKETFRESAA